MHIDLHTHVHIDMFVHMHTVDRLVTRGPSFPGYLRSRLAGILANAAASTLGSVHWLYCSKCVHVHTRSSCIKDAFPVVARCYVKPQECGLPTFYFCICMGTTKVDRAVPLLFPTVSCLQ